MEERQRKSKVVGGFVEVAERSRRAEFVRGCNWEGDFLAKGWVLAGAESRVLISPKYLYCKDRCGEGLYHCPCATLEALECFLFFFWSGQGRDPELCSAIFKVIGI